MRAADGAQPMLPRAAESEGQVLGSILLSPGLIPKVTKLVKISDFTNDAHRATFAVIVSLHRAGTPIDAVTVALGLKGKAPFTDHHEIATYLASTALAVATSAHAEHFARQVSQAAKKSRLHRFLMDHAAHALNGSTPAEIYHDVRAGLDDLARDSGGDEDLTAEAHLDATFDSIAARERPDLIDAGPWTCDIARLPLMRCGVLTIGGQTGTGKTALACQALIDAMRHPGQEHLKLLVANCEMEPKQIIERQLARLSGVSYSAILHRTFTDAHLLNIEVARNELRPVLKRTRFMGHPFELQRLFAEVEAFEPDLLLVDYIQRFSIGGEVVDQRTQTNRTMDACRLIASQGRAVVALSALNRPPGGGDWTTDTISLSAFRESSEIEYSSDNLYATIRARGERRCSVVHLKNRNGQTEDIELEFDGAWQRFSNAQITGFQELGS